MATTSSEPVVWIDTLDWPLMEFLDAAWVDHDMPGLKGGNANVQPVTVTEGYSRALYGHGGIKPTFVNHQRGVGHAPAPLFHYRGADVKRNAARPAQGEGRQIRGHQGRLRQSGHRRAGVQDAELLGAAPAPRRGNRIETRNRRHVLRRDRRHRRDRGRRQALRMGPQRSVRGADLHCGASTSTPARPTR